MKWHIALAALGLVQSFVARGQNPDQNLKSTLEVENEVLELKKKNLHLEAMMQVARNEVHRMDLAVKSKNLRDLRNLRHEHGGNDAEEVERLRLQLDKAKAERKALANTLRQLLAKNSTKIFRAQADKATEAQHAVEQRYAKESAAFAAQIKEANGKNEVTKEMVQTFQEQNMDLQRTIHDLQAKLAKSEQKDKDLANDKMNLVDTMRSLMRDTAKAKKELLVETEKEQKEAKELTAVKAKLANLTKGKKLPKPALGKNARKAMSKNSTLNMKHEESMASKFAKMKDINRYIDRVDVPSEETEEAEEVDAFSQPVAKPPPAAPKESDWSSVNKQMDSLQKQVDASERKKLRSRIPDSPQEVAQAAELTGHSKGLGDWLGLKLKPAEGAIPKDANGLSPIDALDPEAVKQEKIAEAKKDKDDADDGGDGIEHLLSQAKDQLNAMDTAEQLDSSA